MISTFSRPRSLLAAPPRSLPLLLIVAGVALMAVVGAMVGFSVLTTDPETVQVQPGWGVSDEVPTSYGSFSVREVTQLAGLSAEDLAGVTHGVGDLVPPDKEQVELSLVLTNTSAKPVSYSFEHDFKLITSTGGDVEQLPGLSAPSGKLSGHSSLTTQLRFMAPRDGGALVLQYREPGTRRPVAVLLGATDQAPDGVLDGYHSH